MMGEARVITVTKDKIDRLERLLSDFCDQTHTVWAILITSAGQLLVQRGFVYSFDVLAIAALTSGVYNSTMELARIIGEKKFHQFLQEGRDYSVYYIGVNEEYLLVSVFDDRTLPAVVKVASEDFSYAAEKILKS